MRVIAGSAKGRRLKAPREGQKKFRGYLKGVENGTIVLEHGETELRMLLDEIEEARLDPEVEI